MNSPWIRKALLSVLAGAALAVGCGGTNLDGKYRDSDGAVTLELKGGKANLDYGQIHIDGTYTMDGGKLTIRPVVGDTSQTMVFVINRDGSIDGPPWQRHSKASKSKVEVGNDWRRDHCREHRDGRREFHGACRGLPDVTLSWVGMPTKPWWRALAWAYPISFSLSASAQDIRTNVNYLCNGERIIIENCNARDLSDASSCLVGHPDAVTPNGLMKYTNETRGNLKKLLPTCKQPTAAELKRAQEFNNKVYGQQNGSQPAQGTAASRRGSSSDCASARP